MRRLPLALMAAFFAAFCFSCHDDSEGRVPSLPQGEDVPTMSTLDVSTFVSDSGYTKLHITTDVWRIYDDAPEPYWRFPKGLFLEKYDTTMRQEATVRCDSAIYFSRKRLWQLDGNVVMMNTDRDSFLSEQMFWDQGKQLVYSDSFVHIVRTDRIIEGFGFESNQNLSAYTVKRPTGIIPVERPQPREATADTAASDSTASVSPRRRRPGSS